MFIVDVVERRWKGNGALSDGRPSIKGLSASRDLNHILRGDISGPVIRPVIRPTVSISADTSADSDFGLSSRLSLSVKNAVLDKF